ncbi:MAG: gfo/Idh/MocA family oxidoreductase [Actinobacteria bacterium]|nr:gfo/Idh/MocA family oxidoreductase [Actinomycetota bacterium]NDA94761.1 gfo/Idh/MocA family oxidoreductase [Actinomycetota bacterium]NDH81147.1 gfo/Idh/MocA family oxidoreductase [Actinomycetota bacterium]NDH99523.1 gfo/Idh/MocA family oxidoreductase [Actinomycetota bacterium]NDI07933.1 gfo/Idh/MocA family oxidoreductase [Actinomycetota bacterium]
MSQEFKWGILGTGGIALAFARDLTFLNNHLVAAVGSRTKEKAEEFAIEFPGCTAHGSYEKLVTNPEIDAIYVATPHPMHFTNTILALKAGKPVLCEKPFSINASQARAMVEASIENNVALLEAMWMRFLPHIHQVRKIIASGVLGDIISVTADHGQRLADQGIARLVEPSLAGGALLDLGIYPVSFAHMVLGVPEKVQASAVMTDKGVDASTSILFTYASGAQAILTTTMIAQTPCRAVVSGVNGWLEIDRTFYNPTTMRVHLYDGTTTEYPSNYQGHGLREQAIEFANIVSTGKFESEYLTHKHTLEIMELMDLIRDKIGLKYPGE